MRFWLGVHMTNWLTEADVPMFISHRRLARLKQLPVARSPWALDSGGYTELNKDGRWRTSEPEYIEAVQRYQSEIGQLAWAAPMDWMCEPHVMDKTGLSVRAHQERTIANFVRLADAGLPVIPVLQGQGLSDYLTCIDLYERAGVDLWAFEPVGLGTVCRRQNGPEIARIVTELGSTGLHLHGFGMKSAGLARVAHVLTSADSMAWSTRARRAWYHDGQRLCGGMHAGGCANCPAWALLWRQRVIDGMGLFAEVTP